MFQDQSVVSAYGFRPPYPAQTSSILLSLLPATGERFVLDAGCGPGAIARALVGQVDGVDAVDISPGMIALGRTLPGGDHRRLRWIEGPIESAPLRPQYGLIVAAASLHWMDWPLALPRFADHLLAGGFLAIVEETHEPNPWDDEIRPVLARYSLNQDFAPYTIRTVAEELALRGLFEQCGVQETALAPFCQPVANWVASFHARNGFSRERMGQPAAAAFDDELTRIILRHCPDRFVSLPTGARVLWGKPLPQRAPGVAQSSQ